MRSMEALACLACFCLLSALPASAFWTGAWLQGHTASLPHTNPQDSPLAHSIPLPRHSDTPPRHSNTRPRHRGRHSTRRGRRKGARHGRSVHTASSTATTISTILSSSSSSIIYGAGALEVTSQDHPLLPHLDSSALRRFGVPVVATSLLAFDVEDSAMQEMNVRQDRERAPGCASGGRGSGSPSSRSEESENGASAREGSGVREGAESRRSEGGAGQGSSKSSGEPSGRSGESDNEKERLPAACPRFTPCKGSGLPGVDLSACFAPPAQAPLSATSALRLRHVYVNWQGVVFNNATIFNFDDCTLPRDTRYRSKHSHRRGSPVVHLRRAYSLIHHWGRNFYHNMMEVLPQFFSLAEFLKEDPSLPILMKPNQYQENLKYGKNVTGVDASTLNIVFQSTPDVLIFVEELIQPHMPVCLVADVPMIASLRERFFLRPHTLALPFLNQNLEPRYNESLPLADQRSLPEDWKVVVFLRRGKKRALWNNREFLTGVRGVFGKARVQVLRTHTGLSEAMEMFRSTRLFICVHGSALVNSIFMPKGSFIFEIRLKDYNIPVYERMAPGVGLNYFHTMADGGRGTIVRPNMTHVNEILVRIQSAMESANK